MAILHESRFMDNDPRDPQVQPYEAPSEAKRIAKAVAAVERVLDAAQLHDAQKRRARAIVEQLVSQWGAIYVITLVQSVADRFEAEREAQR